MNLLVGFLILLLIALALRFIGNKLVPVAMPTGCLKTIAVGWFGGFLGSVFLHIGPQIAGVYLVPAVVGAAACILTVGLASFVKILLGRV